MAVSTQSTLRECSQRWGSGAGAPAPVRSPALSFHPLLTLCRPRRLVLPPPHRRLDLLPPPRPRLVSHHFPSSFRTPVPPSALSFPHSRTPYSPREQSLTAVVGGAGCWRRRGAGRWCRGGPGWRVRFVVPLSSSSVVLAVPDPPYEQRLVGVVRFGGLLVRRG